jgi:hypothetical protein
MTRLDKKQYNQDMKVLGDIAKASGSAEVSKGLRDNSPRLKELERTNPNSHVMTFNTKDGLQMLVL